jgi:hypothetical protein
MTRGRLRRIDRDETGYILTIYTALYMGLGKQDLSPPTCIAAVDRRQRPTPRFFDFVGGGRRSWRGVRLPREEKEILRRKQVKSSQSQSAAQLDSIRRAKEQPRQGLNSTPLGLG